MLSWVSQMCIGGDDGGVGSVAFIRESIGERGLYKVSFKRLIITGWRTGFGKTYENTDTRQCFSCSPKP